MLTAARGKRKAAVAVEMQAVLAAHPGSTKAASAPCFFSSPGPSTPPLAGGNILNSFMMLPPAPTQADAIIGCEPAVTLSSTAHAANSACAMPVYKIMSRSARCSLRGTGARCQRSSFHCRPPRDSRCSQQCHPGAARQPRTPGPPGKVHSAVCVLDVSGDGCPALRELQDKRLS